MIKQMTLTIKMWKDLRETTETKEMKNYYAGMIAGMEAAIKIVRSK